MARSESMSRLTVTAFVRLKHIDATVPIMLNLVSCHTRFSPSATSLFVRAAECLINCEESNYRFG
jgi:hypothetical protein